MLNLNGWRDVVGWTSVEIRIGYTVLCGRFVSFVVICMAGLIICAIIANNTHRGISKVVSNYQMKFELVKILQGFLFNLIKRGKLKHSITTNLLTTQKTMCQFVCD